MHKQVLLSIIIVMLFSPQAIAGLQQLATELGRPEPIPQNLPWYPIVVFGDNRPAHSGEVVYSSIFYTMVSEIARENPFAVIGVGDHVYNGYTKQVKHFIESTRRLPNLWVVAGNHDWSRYESDREYWVRNVAPNLYYKDDIPGWRIVFINLRIAYPTNTEWPSVKQWLTNTLATDRHKIVVFHEPVHPYRASSKSIGKVLSLLEPLLRVNHPDIVLQGHLHCYAAEKLYGTLYMITGGGGAPLGGPGSCIEVYHYVVFILKPDGSYVYTPVSTTEGIVKIEESRPSTNTVLYSVVNSKEDIYGNPVSIPIRIQLPYVQGYYMVLLANPGETTINITINNNKLLVKAPSNKNYPTYIYNSNGNVWIVGGNSIEIPLSNIHTTAPYTTDTEHPLQSTTPTLGQTSSLTATNSSINSNGLLIDPGVIGLIVVMVAVVAASIYFGRKTSTSY